MNATLHLLKCPNCGAAFCLTEDRKSVFCTGVRKHCFDFSRSGYLNLSAPHPGDGDLKEAVRARTLFLESGYYRPISDRINEILTEYGVKTVLDAGCGEGYYTNRMAASGCISVGVDLSKDGIDHAAKSAKKTSDCKVGFVIAGLFTLPVPDETFDAVTSIFAPCAEEEFYRVLKPNGKLILVGAGEKHLFGLKKALYDTPYLNPGREDLPTRMKELKREKLTYSITVTGKDEVEALFAMTPYYWRTSEKDRAKLKECSELTTDVDFDIFVFEKVEE